MATMTRVALIGALMITASACQKPAATADNGAATGAAAGAEAAGAEPLNGTWKADLASVKIDEQPTVILLKDGNYACTTCVPPLSVAADGKFHPIADRPYFDSMSKTIVDPNTVKSATRKGDRLVGENTAVVSADGKTLTTKWIDHAPGQPDVSGTTIETRVAPTPAGAHAISGSWKTEKFEGITEEALTVTFNVAGDSLTMQSPAGQSYTAKFGGPEVPIKGDNGGTTVKVERLAPNIIRETNSRGGKVVNVTTTTAGADGKLSIVSEGKQPPSTMSYTATRK